MRTITTRASAVIAAAPAAVYAVIADYRVSHPRIIPGRYLSDLVVERGGNGAGTEIRFKLHALGMTRTVRARVDEPEPGRVITETDVETGAVTAFTVDPLEGGQSSLVTISTSWSSPALRAVVEGLLVTPLLQKIFAEELVLLEKYVTSGWPGAEREDSGRSVPVRGAQLLALLCLAVASLGAGPLLGQSLEAEPGIMSQFGPPSIPAYESGFHPAPPAGGVSAPILAVKVGPSATANSAAHRSRWSGPDEEEALAVAALGPSLSRHLLVGAGAGAVVGAGFGLAVVSLADCGGPNCGRERVVGAAMNAALGALLGAAVGGITYVVRR